MGLIGPSIDTLTGDQGGAVPGDGSANINILGSPCMLVDGTPATSTLTLTDLTKLSCYVVSNDAAETRFTSVQAAITQAAADGHTSSADPATVYIWNGTYTENLTLEPWINLVGVSVGDNGFQTLTTIIGAHSASTAGNYSISNILLQSSSASPALSISGAAAINFSAYRSSFDNSSTGNGITINNTNCYISMTESTATADSGRAFDITADQATMINCAFDSATAARFTLSNVASEIHHGNRYGFNRMQLDLNGACTYKFQRCWFDQSTTAVSSVDIDAASSAIFWECSFQCNPASGYYITGSGGVEINGCSISSGVTGQRLDPALTRNHGQLVLDNISYDDMSFTSTTAGQDRYLQVRNTDNTSGTSNAHLSIATGGASSGDPYIDWGTGVSSWSMGIDNSDSDRLKINQTAALGGLNVVTMHTSGEINYPLQPCFLAYQASADNNVTGNNAYYVLGTNTAMTEVFDANSDFNPSPATFTAPVTGRYAFQMCVQLSQVTTTTYMLLAFNASNGIYVDVQAYPGVTFMGSSTSIILDMDAADTCTFVVNAIGVGGNTADITATAATTLGTERRTWVSGKLVA